MAFFFFSDQDDSFEFLPKNRNLTFESSEEGTIIKVTCPTEDWNFGIRFLGEFHQFKNFENNGKERLAPGVHDLYFSASPHALKNGKHETTVTLMVKSRKEPLLENLPLSENYIEQETSYDFIIGQGNSFEIFLKNQSVEDQLYIRFYDDINIVFEKTINLEILHDSFKLFTWGNDSGFDYQVIVTDFFHQAENLSAFSIGNLIVREGDMFNNDPILNSNLTIIPISDKGSVSSGFQIRMDEMDLPPPRPEKAGTVNFHLISKHDNVYVGYAYSVKDSGSDIKIIRSICENIISFLSVNDGQELKKIVGINLPLLGTGAGGLDLFAVFQLYNEIFNRLPLSVKFIISIATPESYIKIKQKYRKRYLPLFNTFQNIKPHQILVIEKMLRIEISRSSFEINYKGELIFLDLQNEHLKNDLAFLTKFSELKHLNLNNCKLDNYDFLNGFKKLKGLYIKNVIINDYGFLKNLPQLVSIDLSGQAEAFLELALPLLGKLKRLWLADNRLQSLDFLAKFSHLELLDIDYNIISNLEPLSKLKNLSTLKAANNQIRDLKPLHSLGKLSYLDISSNKIEKLDFQPLFNSLQFLKIDQNPFLNRFELVLDESNNHLGAIQNFILRQAETNKVSVRLPAKVLLLGNHASGKSSLLEYIISGKLTSKVPSTHIINIQKYPAKKQTMPDAIFYDFGGQDYYHGIYRAFLSGDAVNLILWNAEQNLNAVRTDSKGRITQDFTLDYWLAQKQYLEIEKFYTQTAPTLLIQTHSDQQFRQVHRSEANMQGIKNEFFVSLSSDVPPVSLKKLDERKKALKYLKTAIDVLIEENQVVREEPQWYIDFLLYIIQQNTKADYKGRKVKDLLKYYRRDVDNKLYLLEEDLDQLYKQGLIVYYRDQIPDMVWLNPVALVNHVHSTMLSTQVIEKSEGLIPLDSFSADEQNVVDLLIKQKVIFIHEASDQYIIPNFLSLAQQGKAEFELYTFGLGNPLFTLKFKNFLPFGLINQIICFFGDLPEEKKFWRDRLIFTLEKKAKIMINIDFQHLEIKIFASFTAKLVAHEKQEITKYLFYGIIGLYWDLNLLKFNDYIAYINGILKLDSFAKEDPIYDKIVSTKNFYENRACRPIDLFISLNQTDFINYSDLCDAAEMVSINSISTDESHNFGGRSKTIPIYQFQPFTLTNLNRRKNVAISYSKQDLELVNKFKDYLIPLYEDELINHPWYCTELLAGSDWDEEIQKKFDMADIIFFMISENLMATPYVRDNEIKNAIDKYSKGVPIKIVPIVMVPYHFQRNGDYNLGRFTALPYALKPVTMFDNENQAWDIISDSIRIMIEKELDPGRGDELARVLRKRFEDIIGKPKKGKKTTNTEK